MHFRDTFRGREKSGEMGVWGAKKGRKRRDRKKKKATWRAVGQGKGGLDW